MHFNKSFKNSITLSLIAVSMNLMVLLISFCYFLPHETFAVFYNDFTSIILDGELTVGDYFAENGVTAEIFYISVLIIHILSLLFYGAILVLAILCRNDYKLNAFLFNKRKVLHVFYIILIGLGFLTYGNSLISLYTVYGAFTSLFELASFVLYIIAFIFALKGVNHYKNLVYSINGYNSNVTKKYYQGYDKTEYDNVNKVYEEVKEDEVKDKDEVIDKVDYEELYLLLAKLEKQFKNGEVDEESYKRMKETLLNNYK